MQNHAIGIFDSGVGGLSVFREIRKSLPDESIVYFADSANCPYGSKDKDAARALAGNSVEFLLDQGCKMIVVACNTVTAVAIDEFRRRYHVPFIGMEPALKPAARLTATGKIGVLATENTFNGRLFKQTREKYASGIDVMVQPGYGLVELVENGDHESDRAMDLLKEYLLPMISQGADTLVLGCTHYPFLINTIMKITRNKMQIIDPSQAVAAQTKRILKENKLIADTTTFGLSFFTTGEKNTLENILDQTLDQPYILKGMT